MENGENFAGIELKLKNLMNGFGIKSVVTFLVLPDIGMVYKIRSVSLPILLFGGKKARIYERTMPYCTFVKAFLFHETANS